MYARSAAALVAVLLAAACGDGVDQPQQGDTQVTPPMERPEVQEPPFPPDRPAVDSPQGPLSPDQQTRGAPRGATGGPTQGPGYRPGG
jgi:hypothetical protein